MQRWRSAKGRIRSTVLEDHIISRELKLLDRDIKELIGQWEAFEPLEEALALLGFDAETAAREQFPGSREATDEQRRRAALMLRRMPYAHLEAEPDVSWVPPVSRKAGVSAVVSSKKRARTDQRKQVRGENAELARAAAAAADLLGPLKAREDLQKRLDAERRALRKSLKTPGDRLSPVAWDTVDHHVLAGALRVAGDVDCGYDVLDLDLASDTLLRVEVKSVQRSIGSDGKVDVHLSSNEVRRALETRSQQDVAYRLELYLGFGRLLNVTSALDAALDSASDWLKTEARLEPEGYLLRVKIGK